jgi:DNA-binding transcriptional MerR regulator
MDILNAGGADYAELRSAANRLWAHVIKVLLDTGLRSARLARTVDSLGDRPLARQLGADARKAQREALKYLSKEQLGQQEEQTIRKKMEEIDEALELPPLNGRRRSGG